MASNPAEILAAGQALVPNAGEQMLRQQMGRLQIQGAQLQLDAQQQQLKQAQTAFQRQQSFGHDMQGYLAHPTTTGMVALLGQYPEFHAQIKEAHGALDENAQRTNLTQIGSAAALAAKGDFEGAAAIIRRRIDADKAAGQDVSDDQAMLDQLTSPDEAKRKAAVGMMGIALGGMMDPDKAAAFLKANGLSSEQFTLGQGDVRYDSQGNVIASVAPKPDYLIIPEGGKAVPVGPGGLQTAGTIQGNPSAPAIGSGPTGLSPKAAEMSSALASAGLPAPVVAGFMGNFHIEGGYDGAQGDGGSASGIGQWHADRAANFERVIGKPVTQATPAEQARFVTWEMQNPQAAGMTVAQRDKILAAKTPGEAAALIDQFYERSNGKARQDRIAAANAFAGGAPRGAAQPGDPAGTLYGNPKPGYTLLSPEQAQAQGLDTSKRWQRGPDGQTTAIGDASVAAPGDPTKTGAAYLATVPAGIASQVKALAEGRLPLPSSFALGKPYWQRLLQATAQYDPTFDAGKAKERQAAMLAFTGNGQAAKMVGSVNRVANHLQTLYDASERLVGPDTGFGPLNSMLAYGGQRFQPQSLKAYNTALPLVADELEKIARNSNGTLHGVEQIMANLSPSESLSTRRQAIKTAIELIHGAIEPLQNQFNSAFQGSSARPNIPWVTPRSQAIYDRLAGENFTLGGDQAPSGGPGAVHSSLPAGAHQVGTYQGKPVYQLPNGKRVVAQ